MSDSEIFSNMNKKFSINSKDEHSLDVIYLSESSDSEVKIIDTSKNDNEIDTVLCKLMSDDRACLCEVKGSINFDEIPKSMTVANPDGTFSSSKLENLYPFIDEEEQKENMPDWND